MLDKLADGPRQGYPPIKGWTHTPLRGVDYTEPTSQIREKMTAILHTWGEEHPETDQAVRIKLSPERERF